ncbi:hypothetical protein HHL21_02050 [Massilia sp. RP-1-19]|uniref:Uncharacterized protein n=1 Tax=Massilia polaris TaxID=2728846 RepID=A0A848HKV5_9BURK|nr:hypothetical protein [Massilia polaris]NML59883.1 hypothetical protein [Massilia polaris]
MDASTDTKLTTAALRYLRECSYFKSETGLAPGKANELLSAIIVNRWLAANGYAWKIAISSRPTGVDGVIVGDVAGPRDVEFKSSGTKNASYQFDPKFNYASHGCLVFTQLSEGVPARVFLAIGSQSIASIQSMAELDMKRLNFGAKKDDMALVHTTSKPASAQRPARVDGLADLPVRHGADGRDDRVVVIEGAELTGFLSE